MVILFWCFVLAWMVKVGATDVLYAAKGQTPPRHRERMERIQRGESQARYGVRGWLDDATEDFLRANTQWRRHRAAERARRRLNVPIDDMVDVAQVRPVPEHAEPQWLTPDPSEADLIAEGRRLCPRCQTGQVAELSDGGQECVVCRWPQPRARHETPEPPVPVPPQREEKPMPRRPEPDEDDDLTAEEVLGGLMGPGGLFTGLNAPTCDRCGRAQRLVDGQVTCPCRPVDDRPLAPVIDLFPNVKLIEKEIVMANSEVTGLSTAIAYADAVVNAHQSFTTSGAEGYVGALEQGGNGPDVVASAREAMEASQIATEKWAAHRSVLENQMTVKEAYQSQPDAASKEFLLNG